MELSKLFEVQRVLDAEIEKKHPTEQRERITKKFVAIFVEAGELANELPEIFKFWSNKKNNYEKALVELVDVWHFTISLGLEFGYELLDFSKVVKNQETGDRAAEFNNLFYRITRFESDEDSVEYMRLVSTLYRIGEMLGFTWEQIESAYMNKNQINHARQENDY
ncbi:dUTP diphosphatase [Planomicrobium sp. CPCC 101079]|uniref:dUTP diphosphatase n=1 Tax=Planomicrobium sp. CPCC 101079 TaxID=2599618 RepID=UPI0011B8016A|nr:dUTP diphosphatase [Planomicrobium sp. CPCC 101079]TWT04624.1 dUTPase [Planomicrobium sp. CPCC 101079]